MSLPSAMIAEDEPLLRTEIRTLLQTLWPQLHIAAEVSDGLEAIQALDRLAPDILFLDIQMPGATGIDVARHASGKAHVVFITAFDAYALQAFEQGALDYILKPITTERMKLTVERLQQRLREPPADLRGLTDLLKNALNTEPRYLKWLTVPKGQDLHVVAVSDISYLRADNKYTTIVTRTTSFLCTSSLKEMKEKLDPSVFWQIHRSVIVNVGTIETIYRSFRGALEVKLKNRDELLPVSAAYAHLFKQRQA
jgi:DNA-binding LytR/AlgR family response regulator